jgi:hypothetical protein
MKNTKFVTPLKDDFTFTIIGLHPPAEVRENVEELNRQIELDDSTSEKYIGTSDVQKNIVDRSHFAFSHEKKYFY